MNWKGEKTFFGKPNFIYIQLTECFCWNMMTWKSIVSLQWKTSVQMRKSSFSTYNTLCILYTYKLKPKLEFMWRKLRERTSLKFSHRFFFLDEFNGTIFDFFPTFNLTCCRRLKWKIFFFSFTFRTIEKTVRLITLMAHNSSEVVPTKLNRWRTMYVSVQNLFIFGRSYEIWTQSE